MKIICIKGFRDKTTAKNIKDQVKRKVNEIIDCDDDIARSRINLGLAKEYVEPIKEADKTNEVETEKVETPKKNKRKKGE